VPIHAQEQRLSGFSLRPVVRSRVYRPEWPDEVPAMLAGIPESLLPRGAGMAYGDAGLNDGRGTLDTRRLDRILALDEGAATVTCQGGVPLRPRRGLPGLFPAVTPGTWKSTVGGCIACDVHGKNHHLAGSFLDHVLRLRLALADGRVVECSRQENPDLLHATAGGMGLTGVILDATLRLQRVASAWMRVRYVKNRDLDATFAALERPEAEPYSVAWLDVLARGARLGRSVLMLGAHAAPEELPAAARRPLLVARPLGRLPRRPAAMPPLVPASRLLGPIPRRGRGPG
jgi:FAD/FMN-containing dehydrogenase